MKKILVLFLVVLIGVSLYAAPVAADCWSWSVSEDTLAVTLKSHTPNTATSVTVPEWYYPSDQETRDAIQAVVDVQKAEALLGSGRPGVMALVNTFESTGGLPVLAIGEHAFDNYTNLKQISLPESVVSIGEYAFWRCYALESFNIPRGVTSISYATFASCSGLRDVTLPFGLTSIGPSAFEGCIELNNIDIPATVTEICHAAFSGCAALQYLNPAEGLQYIDEYAFYECDGLQWVYIPKSVTYIGENAFYGCYPIIYTMNNYAIDYANKHGLTWQYFERT
jgi:hypothetical protein